MGVGSRGGRRERVRGTEPRGRLRWRSNETRKKGRERRRICRRRRCDGIPIALASLTLDTSPPCRRCKAASQERSDRCRTAAAGTRASRRRRRAKLPRSRRRERCFFVFCFPHLSSRFRGTGELHCPKRVRMRWCPCLSEQRREPRSAETGCVREPLIHPQVPPPFSQILE